MCGRYVAALDPEALVAEFDILSSVPERLTADYNVAPTKRMYIVIDDETGQANGRSLEIARWGLIPSWAKDPSIASRLINARVETVSEKPSFRSAFAKRRCLVPANGYYEWYTAGKQPFYIHSTDDSPLAMAGLYEWWQDPSVEETEAGNRRLTCTVITTAAATNVAKIHDRMPLMIARADRSSWLNHSLKGETALAQATTGVYLSAYPVSTMVNNVRNNGPALIEAMAAASD